MSHYGDVALSNQGLQVGAAAAALLQSSKARDDGEHHVGAKLG